MGTSGGYILFYDHALCYKCAHSGHRPDQCKSAKRCEFENCTEYHVPFLHSFDKLGYNLYREKYPKRAEKARALTEAAQVRTAKKRKAPNTSLQNKKPKFNKKKS